MAKKIENELDFNVFGDESYSVFDTETEGLETDYDIIDGKMVLRKNGTPCSVIEVASMSFKNGKYVGFTSNICKPVTLVSPIAAATHGYRNSQLVDQPGFHEIKATQALRNDIDAGFYIVAHNMKFDKRMLMIHGIEIPEDQCIDTLIVARHVFKDGLFGLEETEFYAHLNGTAPEMHQLQYFRSLMEMDDQKYFKQAMKLAGLTEIKEHTALSDVAVLWIFLIWMGVKAKLTLADMARLSKTPVLNDKFLYGQKWQIRDMTFNEIIAKNFKTPWATTKKGYEELMWPFQSGGMMADVEYSIIYHMGHAILRGAVPYTKGKNDYKQFLPLAVKYCFSKENIILALDIMGEKKSFLKKMWEISHKNIEKERKSPLRTDIDPEDFPKYISKRDNRSFLHTYAENYRKDLLLAIAEEDE